jgi:hypothetical protein
MIMNKTGKIGVLNETVTAGVNGKYKIQVINEGETALNLNLGAFSKASPLAFSGQMMLIITGIVIVGLGIRTRMQS